MSRALVLGGGGIAGIAWLNGLFYGFAQENFDPLDADLIVGTSAGACAAAQLTSGLPKEELFSRQTVVALQPVEPLPDPELQRRAADKRPELLEAGDKAAITKARAQFALSTTTIAEETRRAIIAARLPVHEWPSHPLKLVAVEAANGDIAVFDRSSGVSLIDAVAASSAVPAIWPAVTIGERKYVDGGARSTENADLARGYDKILLIVPVGADFAGTPPRNLKTDVGALEAAGSRVFVIEPDAGSRAAITTNLLDPATRRPAALAGLTQGQRLAASASRFWNGD